MRETSCLCPPVFCGYVELEATARKLTLETHKGEPPSEKTETRKRKACPTRRTWATRPVELAPGKIKEESEESEESSPLQNPQG